jgi:hypothetical protein
MSVPKVAAIKSGQQTFAHGGANWTPLACASHLEDGYRKTCDACIETAKLTIDHALAVDHDKARS